MWIFSEVGIDVRQTIKALHRGFWKDEGKRCVDFILDGHGPVLLGGANGKMHSCTPYQNCEFEENYGI